MGRGSWEWNSDVGVMKSGRLMEEKSQTERETDNSYIIKVFLVLCSCPHGTAPHTQSSDSASAFKGGRSI